MAQAQEPERFETSRLLGIAVHAALYMFFGLRPAQREPAEARLHQCLRAVWRKHCPARMFASVDEEVALGRRGLELLSNFAANFSTNAEPIVRERWLEMRLPNRVILFGKVDRVDLTLHLKRQGTLEIVDYKSGRLVLDDDEIADEPAAQVYLLAAEAMFKHEVDRVRFVYLERGVEARWEPEREDVEAARSRLVELTTTMLTDSVFAPQPGDHCARCPFAHLCTEAGRVELADLTTNDALAF